MYFIEWTLHILGTMPINRRHVDLLKTAFYHRNSGQGFSNKRNVFRPKCRWIICRFTIVLQNCFLSLVGDLSTRWLVTIYLAVSFQLPKIQGKRKPNEINQWCLTIWVENSVQNTVTSPGTGGRALNGSERCTNGFRLEKLLFYLYAAYSYIMWITISVRTD